MASTPTSNGNGGQNGRSDRTGEVEFEPSATLEIETGGEPEFDADPALEQGGKKGGRGGRAKAAFRALDEKTAGLRGQATEKARTYAAQGKDKATDALDDFANIFEDAARSIDGKVGSQYGDYARKAAQGVAGFSTTLRDKDVEQLFDEARELVRKSPAVAIGAAVAAGFVIARLVKAGMSDETEAREGKASKRGKQSASAAKKAGGKRGKTSKA
jgi:hypothetical protein